MSELSKQADCVVYTNDVNNILRGLLCDLQKYFKCVDSGHCRTNTGFIDLIFSHWFYKLSFRHFCHKPIKKVKLINDFLLDGNSFGELIPFIQEEVDHSSVSFDIFKDFKCKFEVLLNNSDLSINSKYDEGYIKALNDVYELLHDVEIPF